MKRVFFMLGLVGLCVSTFAQIQEDNLEIEAKQRALRLEVDSKGALMLDESLKEEASTSELDELFIYLERNNLTEQLEKKYGFSGVTPDLLSSRGISEHQLGVDEKELVSIVKEVLKAD